MECFKHNTKFVKRRKRTLKRQGIKGYNYCNKYQIELGMIVHKIRKAEKKKIKSIKPRKYIYRNVYLNKNRSELKHVKKKSQYVDEMFGINKKIYNDFEIINYYVTKDNVIFRIKYKNLNY